MKTQSVGLKIESDDWGGLGTQNSLRIHDVQLPDTYATLYSVGRARASCMAGPVQLEGCPRNRCVAHTANPRDPPSRRPATRTQERASLSSQRLELSQRSSRTWCTVQYLRREAFVCRYWVAVLTRTCYCVHLDPMRDAYTDRTPRAPIHSTQASCTCLIEL